MPAPARVLHFLGLAHGGVESFFLRVCRRLDRTPLEFDLALAEWADCPAEQELADLGVRVLRYPCPRQRAALALGRAAAHLIAAHGPYAAVHSHMFLPAGLLLRAAHRAGVPVRIAHAHAAPPGPWPLRFLLYRRMMRGLLHRHATHLLACSSAAAEAMLGTAAQRDWRVQVIPNPVELAPYADLPADRHESRRRLGWPQEGPLLGYVGRLTTVKNLPFLWELYVNLSRLVPSAHLLLVGTGNLGPWLRARRTAADHPERVHLLGWREDIPEIMAGLDVLLLPSHTEGLPITVLEAQAAGTPCLCSKAVPPEADLGLGLVWRLPLDQGLSPWLAALSEALQTPRPAWRDREQRFVATGYDAASVARRLEAIYLGESGSP